MMLTRTHLLCPRCLLIVASEASGSDRRELAGYPAANSTKLSAEISERAEILQLDSPALASHLRLAAISNKGITSSVQALLRHE